MIAPTPSTDASSCSEASAIASMLAKCSANAWAAVGPTCLIESRQHPPQRLRLRDLELAESFRAFSFRSATPSVLPREELAGEELIRVGANGPDSSGEQAVGQQC